jgi:hypothetical protein
VTHNADKPLYAHFANPAIWRDHLPSGAEFQFSATTSPLLRSAEESRIPLTWSLAPGGWDGLSRLQGNAGFSRGMKRQSGK